jgi:hypothetical protein
MNAKRRSMSVSLLGKLLLFVGRSDVLIMSRAEVGAERNGIVPSSTGVDGVEKRIEPH